MRRRLVVERAAEEDLVATTTDILQDSPSAARRFVTAARRTFEQLARQPEMGRQYQTPHPRLQGLRIWRIRGFTRYLIFYRATEETVFIERVLYGGRDIARILDGED